MTSGEYGYMLDQLAKMYDTEMGPMGGYGVLVKSNSRPSIKPILIDTDALLVLIAHYKERNERSKAE